MNTKKDDVWKAVGGAAIVTLLLFLCGLAAAMPARAAGSDGPTPYTVDVAGITLPSGMTFPDDGHVNIKTSAGDKGIHFESLNNQPSGQWIGKSFLPWSAFGITACTQVTWVQVSMYNEHYGEGAQPPVGALCPPPVPPKPDDPQPRTKVTDRCQDAARVTDYYTQTYVLVDNDWILGPEKWDYKTVEPLSADQCGRTPQTWDKVTLKCEPNKNYVFTDHYVKNWFYDKAKKSWVLDTKWTWLSKDRSDATEAQCPVVTKPEEEPSPTDPPTTGTPGPTPTTPVTPTPTPTQPSTDPTSTPEPTVTGPAHSPDPTISAPSSQPSGTGSALPSASPQQKLNVPSDNSSTPSPTRSELAQTGTSALLWALGALAMIGGGAWLIRRTRNA